MSIQEKIYFYSIGATKETKEIKDFLQRLNEWNKQLTKQS